MQGQYLDVDGSGGGALFASGGSCPDPNVARVLGFVCRPLSTITRQNHVVAGGYCSLSSISRSIKSRTNSETSLPCPWMNRSYFSLTDGSTMIFRYAVLVSLLIFLRGIRDFSQVDRCPSIGDLNYGHIIDLTYDHGYDRPVQAGPADRPAVPVEGTLKIRLIRLSDSHPRRRCSTQHLRGFSIARKDMS